MSTILNSLNIHNFPIFQPIFMKLVSKFMFNRALSDKLYLLSGLLSPLNSSAQGATYSAFVVIFISFCKTYLVAFNLMLLHVYMYECVPKHDVETVHGIWKHLEIMSEI